MSEPDRFDEQALIVLGRFCSSQKCNADEVAAALRNVAAVSELRGELRGLEFAWRHGQAAVYYRIAELKKSTELR